MANCPAPLTTIDATVTMGVVGEKGRTDARMLLMNGRPPGLVVKDAGRYTP